MALDTAATLKLRARELAQQRRFEEARACLQQLETPGDADVASLWGAIALGLGELDAAIAALRTSLELGPSQEAAVNLSAALEARGDRAGALAATAQGLNLAFDDTAALRRFRRLAGDALGQPRPTAADGGLTIFFYQPRSMPYNGHTPRAVGIGGVESAIIYLAEALARLGHRLVVFNNSDEHGTMNGVEYARWPSLQERCVAERPHVVVSVRAWELIGSTRLAPLQIFWSGDGFYQPYIQGLSDPAAREQIDFVMLQSDWQAATYIAELGIPAWQVLMTRLGAAASANGEEPPADDAPRSRRLVYASIAERGLDVLLQVFPRIRAACPDAELEIFSSLRLYGKTDAEDQSEFGGIYARTKAEGVTLVGTVPQPELARRLRDARVLAYPNNVPETFCIAAIEAAAAGCPVVTTSLGALPQTVGAGGICIPGDPASAPYQEAFVAACVALLTDDAAWRQLSRTARDRAWRDYTWAAVAGEWDTVLRAALAVEPPVMPRLAAHINGGRGSLALKMLDREAPPEAIPPPAWQALRSFVVWQAGGSDRPGDEMLRLVALHFRSLGRTIQAATIPTAA